MPTSTFSIKQGDRTPLLSVTLLQSDGVTPVDLTDADDVHLLMRLAGKRTAVNSMCEVSTPPTAGVVTHTWVDRETSTVGSYEAAIRVVWLSGEPQTFPTDGFFTVVVEDNIELLVNVSSFPTKTPVIFGTGSWAWTPTIATENGFAVEGAEVRVYPSKGSVMGPATTDESGRCISSDGEGAFRLNQGAYTISVTTAGANPTTVTYRLEIDAVGNGVML